MSLGAATSGTWPEHLQPGAIRWTRASGDYEATVAFYRDLVGIPVLESFTESFGSDGTIFGLPGTEVQLEIVRGSPPDAATAELDLLVLYLDDAAAVDSISRRLEAAGRTADPDQHPYWAANGAVTFRDPDARGIVFAPWVYGRDPEPVDAAAGPSGGR